MLSNHLTSILRESDLMYKILGAISLVSLISCSSIKMNESTKPANDEVNVDNQTCKSEFTHFEGRNLVTAAQIKSSILKNCFLNYLRFETNKKQTIGTCNQLSISGGGKVNYVQVTDLKRKQLPKDLIMCMKQEYWKMDFSGLQLGKSYVINFPLTFTSK
jgi:hypothetical protein